MEKLFEDWRRHLNEEEIEEGLEQLTPENFSIALQAFEKFIQEPAIVTALLGGGVAAAVEAVKKNFQAEPESGLTEPARMDEGYYSKGKCVYKKKDDSKVGCTDGPVKDYLAALYANVDDAKEK